MYYRFYGLKAAPFAVTPSRDPIYMASAHHEALAALEWGLRDPNGFALVVGEPGTGKTSLLFDLLETEHEGIRIVNLSQMLSFAEILRSIATDLEIDQPNASVAEFARLLEDRLNSLSIRLVLVFDEAQALDNATLEQLRLFSNHIVDASALIQIVFIGQPELQDRLKEPALRALDQRIATRAELLPLRPREVREYVEHRLRACGGSGKQLFSAAALRSLMRNSSGIPREINLVCHGALILAYVGGRRRVTAAMIREALNHYRGLQRSSAGFFHRCWTYLKTMHQQIARVPIFFGAILSLLLLLPQRSANLHEGPVNPGSLQDASLVLLKNPAKNVASSNSPGLNTPPKMHSLAGVRELSSGPNPTRESKSKASYSVMIEEGDTSSSLAEANLRPDDPRGGARSVKASRLLANPDLIYPGHTIFLPSGSE